MICVAKASFRDECGYRASVSRALSGDGPELIVVSIGTDGSITQSNATYLGKGRALTHGHEDFARQRTMVVSYWGDRGVKQLPCSSINGDIRIDKLQLDYPEACKIVVRVQFPKTRSLTPRVTTQTELPDIYKQEGIEFGPEYELALAKSELGIARTDDAFTGPDFCVLEFAPYEESHPVAVLADVPFAGRNITIRGCSIFIHYGDILPIAEFLKKRREAIRYNIMQEFQIKDGKISKDQAAAMNRVFEERAASVGVPLMLARVCFSQSVKVLENKLMATAVCAPSTVLPTIESDEVFDPMRTPPTIEAVVVGGLSGAGVYDDKGMLIGLVSRAHRPELIAAIEKELSDSRYAHLQPDKAQYPLFNVHQLVYADMLDTT